MSRPVNDLTSVSELTMISYHLMQVFASSDIWESHPIVRCPIKAGVVDRIGAGGSMYSLSRNEVCPVAGDERSNVRVVERIGAGGSTYLTSQPVS